MLQADRRRDLERSDEAKKKMVCSYIIKFHHCVGYLCYYISQKGGPYPGALIYFVCIKTTCQSVIAFKHTVYCPPRQNMY